MFNSRSKQKEEAKGCRQSAQGFGFVGAMCGWFRGGGDNNLSCCPAMCRVLMQDASSNQEQARKKSGKSNA